MIDLHMHTTYSDGADNLIQLLKKAESLKLEYISITDHDNCKAYKELKNLNISNYFNGKIIPGIEIKCAFDNGKLIELLGYNIDTDKMQEWADEYYKDKTKDKLQQKYFDRLYDACKKKELIVSNKQDIEFDPKKEVLQYLENCKNMKKIIKNYQKIFYQILIYFQKNIVQMKMVFFI